MRYQESHLSTIEIARQQISFDNNINFYRQMILRLYFSKNSLMTKLQNDWNFCHPLYTRSVLLNLR